MQPLTWIVDMVSVGGGSRQQQPTHEQDGHPQEYLAHELLVLKRSQASLTYERTDNSHRATVEPLLTNLTITDSSRYPTACSDFKEWLF